MKVSLPNMLSSFDGFNALSNLADTAAGLTGGTLDVSLAALSVFDPNMAAPLGAVLTTIRDRSNSISIVDVPSLPFAVLEKNGFLRCFGYPDTAPLSGTAVPYTRFSAKEIKLFYDFSICICPAKGFRI